jgi:hypothetical protein
MKPAAASVTTSRPGAQKLTETTDPGAPTAGSFTAPPDKATPRWGRSSSHLIPQRRHHHHPASAAGEPYPTIYRPRAQIEGFPTLPPPHGQPEREVAVDPAIGGARDLNSFPFASPGHCSREKEKRRALLLTQCYRCICT